MKPTFYTLEEHSKSTIICPGDIIAGMDAEFKPHIWLGTKSFLNQRLCHFKPKENFHKYFILKTIEPLLDFFENTKVGTTVIHLGKSDIDTWNIIIPESKINSKFSLAIENIFYKIINNAQEVNSLQEFRNLILPKLMSGKIRIPTET